MTATAVPTTAQSPAVEAPSLNRVLADPIHVPDTEAQALALMEAVAAKFNITYRAMGRSDAREAASDLMPTFATATFSPYAAVAAAGMTEDAFYDRVADWAMERPGWMEIMTEAQHPIRDEDPVRNALETLVEEVLSDALEQCALSDD